MRTASLSVIKNKEKTLFLIVLVFSVICMTGGCNRGTENQVTSLSPVPLSAGVEYWQSQSHDLQLIKWAEADLNADEREDAVVIYRQDDKKCRMLIVINSPDGYRLTETVAAPVSDQQISFIDFDNKSPNEMVVSGKNGNYVGIGIFRLENGQIVNVFDDDYDKCC